MSNSVRGNTKGKYPTVAFVSVGSCNDIEDDNNMAYLVLREVLPGTHIIRVIDRDDKSDQEVNECRTRGVRVLGRRTIESYLLDDEILSKLCDALGASAKRDEVIGAKRTCIQQSIGRGNPSDDIKSAAGPISVELKRILELKQCGNSLDAFFRDTLVPLITEDTKVYREIEGTFFQDDSEVG